VLQIVRTEGAENREQRASDPAAIRPATLVDSCVLLDVITGDQQWADWSAGQIAAAVDAGRVVINPLIYGAAVTNGHPCRISASARMPPWRATGC
jgi:hypothetical protein